MSGRLDGKVALISGAARGQGAAEARLFVREGASVVIGDILVAEGERVAAEIATGGGPAIFVELDVTREADWAGRGGDRSRALRQARHPDQQRRHLSHRGRRGRDPRAVAPGDRHQPDRRLARDEGRGPGHASSRWRLDRQHLLDRRAGRLRRGGRVSVRRKVPFVCLRRLRRSSTRKRGSASTRCTPGRSTPTWSRGSRPHTCRP